MDPCHGTIFGIWNAVITDRLPVAFLVIVYDDRLYTWTAFNLLPCALSPFAFCEDVVNSGLFCIINVLNFVILDGLADKLRTVEVLYMVAVNDIEVMLCLSCCAT